VRAETSIACNPTSIASVAVRLAAQALPTSKKPRWPCWGGRDGPWRSPPCARQPALVINRSQGGRLLAEVGTPRSTFEALPAALQQVDILITS
jgi:glutamyl-tRNA reductase